MQAVLRNSVTLKEAEGKILSPGAAVRLTGKLQASRGKGQQLDFVINSGSVVAGCDAARHPFLSTGFEPSTSLARKTAHLRTQIPSFAATLRLRARLEAAMASYLDGKGYTQVRPPIMTSSDCEGGGEVFQVVEPKSKKDRDTASAGTAATPTYLTVSSQLHLEALMLGLGRVYTFTPAFRAEDSATNRHLREFWMCEVEMPTMSDSAASELQEVIVIAEESIKAGARAALGIAGGNEEAQVARQDAQYLYAGVEGKRLDDLERYIDQPWARMTYGDAIETLQRHHVGNNGSSTPPPAWGHDLSSEQERFLAEQVAQGPVFVTDYPAHLKPFYMREGEDAEGRRIARCFDLLVPGLGELVGGSLREDNIAVLKGKQQEAKGNRDDRAEALSSSPALNAWYVDSLRSSGMPPHGGFGIGMERLVAWLANRESVRDVSAFPRVGRSSAAAISEAGARWQY